MPRIVCARKVCRCPYAQMARAGNDRVSLVPFVWENLHKAIKTMDENNANAKK